MFSIMNIFKYIIARDIVVRHKIRNTRLAREMAIYLLTNIGKEFSYKSLKETFGVGSVNTIISLISYFGFTTGEGVFGGSPRYFQGVRLVNANDSTLVHMYPDEIRPGADLTVICRGCRKQHPASNLPSYCGCGWRFR